MNFIDLAKRRRSVRRFKEQEVDQKLIEQIIETTLTAPSSRNCRSTRLGVVTDREIMKKLGDLRSTGSKFMESAPMAFIVMGDESESNLWEVNSSISAAVLQFAVEELGLGSCWVHVKDRLHKNDNPEAGTAEEYIYNLIPESKANRILCVIAVGHPESEGRPHDIDQELKSKMVVFNK